MVLELFVALVVALLFSSLLVSMARPRADREVEAVSAGALFLFFVLILFLGTWAGGVWVAPFGPAIGGVTRPRTAEGAEAEAAASVFGAFCWSLVLALLVAIIFGYAT